MNQTSLEGGYQMDNGFEFVPMDDRDDDVIAYATNQDGVSFKVIGTEDRDVLGGANVNIISKDEVGMDTDYLIIVYLPMMRQIHESGQIPRFLKGVSWAVDQMELLEDEGLTEI